MQILYKGQVGSHLYNCEGIASDNDYFILAPDNDIIHGNELKNLSCLEDNFLYPINIFMNKIFTTESKSFQYNQQNANLPEMLFSLPDPTISTPISEWLIENRQLILDNNRPYFRDLLLARGIHLLNYKHKGVYDIAPKKIIKAIINLQTYINYASNPEDGFFKAQHLTPEQLEMIQMARQGLVRPADLYNHLQKLRNQSTLYSEFWTTAPNYKILNELSNEMYNIIEKSINNQ